MNRYLTFIMLLFLAISMLGCSGEQQSAVQEITIDQLMSSPEQYQGEYVSVEGFYFDGFEVQIIAEVLEYSGYAEGHLVPKGGYIWIGGEGIPWEVWSRLHKQIMMGPEERFGKVRLKGKFEYGEKYGHLGGYGSQIVPSEVELMEWSPQSIIPVEKISQEESHRIAEEFVRNSPTFKYDGIEETLRLTEMYPPNVTLRGWQFIFEFDSRHTGYGDRTGQILAQVITPHRIVIVVEQGKVTYGVIDDRWDMVNQQEIK